MPIGIYVKAIFYANALIVCSGLATEFLAKPAMAQLSATVEFSTIPPQVEGAARLDLSGIYGTASGCKPAYTGETEGFRLLPNAFIATEWGCTFHDGEVTPMYGHGKTVGWKVGALCSAEGTEWQQTLTIVEDRANRVAFVIIEDQLLAGNQCEAF